MALSFGVTVLPDPPYQRFVELMALAREPRLRVRLDVRLAPPVAGVVSTPDTGDPGDVERMKFGHLVTNPGTREPTVVASGYATLHDISNGRMVMAIGRGDSARRTIGQQPVKVAEFETACRMIKEFMNGREVHWNDKRPAAQVGAAGAAARSRCGSRVTGRRHSPSPVASATAWSSSSPTRRSSSGSWAPRARRPRRRAATRASSSASSARRATSPTTSPTRASRRAGSRRWSPITSRT